MIEWRYFIHSNQPETVESGTGALLRLEAGDPWALGEVMMPDGNWVISDDLVRYHLLGSNDIDLNETTPERARAILLAWQQRGRIRRLPASLPGDPADGQRAPDEQQARDELRAQARATQAEIERIYASVPTPPGAGTIRKPGTD